MDITELPWYSRCRELETKGKPIIDSSFSVSPEHQILISTAWALRTARRINACLTEAKRGCLPYNKDTIHQVCFLDAD